MTVWYGKYRKMTDIPKVGIYALIEEAEHLAAAQPVDLRFGTGIVIDAKSQQIRAHLQSIINYEIATKIALCCLSVPMETESWLRSLRYVMKRKSIPEMGLVPVAYPADFYTHISVMMLERTGKINSVSRADLLNKREFRDEHAIYRWNDDEQIVIFPFDEIHSSIHTNNVPTTAVPPQVIKNMLEPSLFEKLRATPIAPISTLGLPDVIVEKLHKFGYADTTNFDAIVDSAVLPTVLEFHEHKQLREALWNYVLDNFKAKPLE